MRYWVVNDGEEDVTGSQAEAAAEHGSDSLEKAIGLARVRTGAGEAVVVWDSVDDVIAWPERPGGGDEKP